MSIETRSHTKGADALHSHPADDVPEMFVTLKTIPTLESVIQPQENKNCRKYPTTQETRPRGCIALSSCNMPSRQKSRNTHPKSHALVEVSHGLRHFGLWVGDHDNHCKQTMCCADSKPAKLQVRSVSAKAVRVTFSPHQEALDVDLCVCLSDILAKACKTTQVEQLKAPFTQDAMQICLKTL